VDETTDIDVDPADIAETPPEEIPHQDGTTVVSVDADVAPGVDEQGDFYANLAMTLPDDVLNDLAEEYLEKIDQNIEARKKRDEQYADGLKKTGIAEPAPGGADFEGASRATHPVLAESYVDFAASSIKELFPPNGPVRTKIEGKPNHEKTERAKRKAEFMNWQLTTQIKSYRGELERLLTQLPAGGTQFQKFWYNEDKKRIDTEFIPIDDFILPYNAKNFYDCQNRFIRLHLSQLELDRKIESGEYRDWTLPPPSGATMEETKSAKQTAKIEGKEDNYSGDDEIDRFAYEGVIFDNIAGDTRAPERPVPYLITIDHESRKILGLYRNWEEQDTKTYSEIEYIVDYTFIPWRGAYGIGLPQLIGGLSDALTGSLRCLLDSALIATDVTAIKLKGAPGGASYNIDPTQVTEIDAMGQDDIRKVAMPLPFPQPSPVLFQLLGFLTTAAKSVVSTAEEKIAEASNQMPVGTALALIEQGAKVFSAIHARLHDSQRRALEIIHRLNRDHLPEKTQYGTDPDDFVTRQDFEGPMDVHPVSDPNIFSETQRFAQIQAVYQQLVQLAQVGPQLQPVLQATGINLHALMKRSFEQMKFPDYQEILPDVPVPVPTNPCDENIDLALAKPVKAFPGQDHQAHIQVHADFAQSPFFGLSPAMAPQYAVNALNHIQDHLFTFYQELMKQDSGLSNNPQAENTPQAAEALAKSSAVVSQAMAIAFAKIPPLMQAALQHIKAAQPKPPPDPMVAVAQQNVQMQGVLGQAKIQQAKEESAADLQQKSTQAALDHDADLQKARISAAADLEKAARNNDTARWIALLKELSGHITQLRDGVSTENSPKET
jgi:hypothetical protein